MPKPLRDRSPTYIKPGVDREMLVRIQPASRDDIDHIRKLVFRNRSHMPSLGVFLAVCASIGVEAVTEERDLGKAPKLSNDPVEEVERRNRLPIKQQILDAHRLFYRGLPAAGLGEFIVFLATRGALIFRDRYGAKNPYHV